MPPSNEAAKPVISAFQQAKFLTSCDEDTLNRFVEASLDQLLQRSEAIDFWRQRLSSTAGESGVKRLQKLPILTREHLQEDPRQLRMVVPGSSPEQYSFSQTSGSTGKPVSVLKYRPIQSVQSSVMALLIKEWAGIDISQNYARLRSGTEETSSDSWGFPYTLFGKTGRLMLLDINIRKPSGILNELVDQKVGYIHGNVTILRALALEAMNSGRREEMSLIQAFTWAERVFREDRTLVRDALGVEIWDIYSSEELGVIALQCSTHQHLHVLPFRSIVEILDDNDQPCEPGETGRVVVTNLRNPVQPLIRYELGDLARFMEPCPTYPNLPVIEPEITRARDSYTTKGGELIFPRFGGAEFLGYRGLKDFQVSLYSNSLVFQYASYEPLADWQIESIKKEVGSQFAGDYPVTVVRLEQDEMFSHWKRRTFYVFEEPFNENNSAV